MKTEALKPSDLKVGHTFEGKRPRSVFCFPHEYLNDRTIVYVGLDSVQYDSPTVRNGRLLPSVPKAKFLQWAGKDITGIMPKHGWRKYERQPS